jgi:pyruvate formate lyase activating enzyme
MEKINRRHFLYCSAALACHAMPAVSAWSAVGKTGPTAGSEDIRGRVIRGDAPDTLWEWSREGMYYTKTKGNKVICGTCPHRCVLAPGDRSVCRSRVNIKGKLYSLAYGNPCAVNVDPVEKKPLYHFKPRTAAFSIAATGCNFRCLNCQNWEISQARPHDVRHMTLFPASVVKAAEGASAQSIAYTYSEAITFYEYMLDTARLARAKNINNLLISNGYINQSPLLELCKVLDGANVNLKAYSDAVYRKLNGGRLAPVLRTLKTMHDQDVHFEITNLIVPGYTDDEEMVLRMCEWILKTLGPDHPLHFLRFSPRYRLNRLPPTPVSTLERFRELAMKAGVRYAYLGNVPIHEGNNTYCHHCGKLLVERKGYDIPVYQLDGSRCRFCRTRIPGVWQAGAENEKQDANTAELSER